MNEGTQGGGDGETAADRREGWDRRTGVDRRRSGDRRHGAERRRQAAPGPGPGPERGDEGPDDYVTPWQLTGG